MIEKIKIFIKKVFQFFSHEIWNVDTNGIGATKKLIYDIIKSFILTYKNINFSLLGTRASALTYSTLLSIVPILAVLFAIARGFGFRNLVQSELFSYFQGQEEVLKKATVFIDKSLEYAQGGIFVGVGIILLLYTVINLLANVENVFNETWKVKIGRTYYRQFTDYIALILITPVFLVCNAGLSLFINTVSEFQLIGLVISPILKILPFVLTIFLFTFVYLYIPNTKVKFSSALFAGIVAGIAFQIFQEIYITGQIWISKYNAIYGSFAALPLLLLWMQLSWYICLIGVELSFSFQNIKKYSFEKQTINISNRYKDFIALCVTKLIVKRFDKGESPLTADEISETFKIPTQLTSDVLFILKDVGVILETPTNEDLVNAFIPALDINKITVAYLFDKLDINGSEDFKVDKTSEFKKEWETILNMRKIIDNNFTYLVKDL